MPAHGWATFRWEIQQNRSEPNAGPSIRFLIVHVPMSGTPEGVNSFREGPIELRERRRQSRLIQWQT
jgi:hypothetical protein